MQPSLSRSSLKGGSWWTSLPLPSSEGSNIGPKYCSVPVCKVICFSRERVAD